MTPLLIAWELPSLLAAPEIRPRWLADLSLLRSRGGLARVVIVFSVASVFTIVPGGIIYWSPTRTSTSMFSFTFFKSLLIISKFA